MIRSALRAAGSFAVLLLAPLTLDAQAPRPLTLDLSVGQSGGLGGGEYKDRQGVAVDGAVAYAVRRAPGGMFVAGLSASLQGPLGDDAVCVPGSRGQCLSSYPGVTAVALLAGWEGRHGRGRSTGATARLVAGPAYVRLDDLEGPTPRSSTAGLQARLDLATPHLGPAALVGSLRATAVPRFRGETYGIWAFGVGLRIW